MPSALLLTEKDEFIALPQTEELEVLSFEAEMRAGRVEPEPRLKERVKPILINHLPAVDHERRAPDMRPAVHERLPAKNTTSEGGPDTRICLKCQKP